MDRLCRQLNMQYEAFYDFGWSAYSIHYTVLLHVGRSDDFRMIWKINY